MDGDEAGGDWQPPADLPVEPEARSGGPVEEPSWAPPTGLSGENPWWARSRPDVVGSGHAPDALAAPGTVVPPPSGEAIAPPSGAAWPGPPTWAAPGDENPWAPPGAGGYPPFDRPGYPPYGPPPGPSRRRGALIAIGIVVVLAVVGAVVSFGLLSARTHSPTGSASAPSSAAAPQPSSSAPTPSTPGSTAPGGSGQPNAPAASGPLDGYLVPPSALGSGAQMVLLDGGRSVTDQATLDFCNFAYTSETMRSARVQVGYASGSDDMSNEFVKYRPGGAAKAWAEIQQAVRTCPSTFRDTSGTIDQIQSTTQVAGLAAEHLVVTFRVTGSGLGGPVSEWSTAVYQFAGDYFSGVYVFGADRTQVMNDAERLGATAATLVGEAAAGKPGTGGGPIASPQPGNGNGNDGTQT